MGVTVGYWSIRGLAAPMRMMLSFKNIPFHAECYDLKVKPEGGYDASDWFTKKPALKARNPLMNLPYVIDDDVVIAQSNACLIHLGRKYGMWGVSDSEVSQCEQLLCEIMDLRNKMTDFVYSGTLDVVPGAQALLDAVSGPNGSLAKLELCLAANAAGAGAFLVSNFATAPDFHLWELLDQYLLLASTLGLESPLAKFPLLAGFHSKFGALPSNARYLSSPLHTKLPCNNLMAVFGSVPGGAAFRAGQAIDWHGLSGEY